MSTTPVAVERLVVIEPDVEREQIDSTVHSTVVPPDRRLPNRDLVDVG